MDPTSTKSWLMGTEAFERRMPHHDGIEALWETKWKFPVRNGPTGSIPSSRSSSSSVCTFEPLSETLPSFAISRLLLSGSAAVSEAGDESGDGSVISFETAAEASSSSAASSSPLEMRKEEVKVNEERTEPEEPADDEQDERGGGILESMAGSLLTLSELCTKSVYPFHDGQYEDFAPIFEKMIADKVPPGGVDPTYTRAFFPGAKKLEEEGDEAAKDGDKKKASDLYLRSACLLRIARFPYITGYPAVNDADKWEAWEWQKRVYMKAGSGWDEPVEEVEVEHVFKGNGDRESIPIHVRVPGYTSREKKCPVVILMTGLDGYRPDNTSRCEEFLSRGWGVIVVEIPGTADCPANSADPTAAERLWDSLFLWMKEKNGRFDMDRVLVWGLSTGGYYAVRIAHTHKESIRGCVAQGAGVHWFFDERWLRKMDGHEYPFQASPAFAMKHGFASVEEYFEKAREKFSLLDAGILEKPSTRLLLINGTLDGLMPIDDSMLLFEHGTPKEGRFFPGALHMGYPMANSAVYPWMESVMKGE